MTKLTRKQVADQLKCSIASVRRMEGSELHPTTGEGDVRYFDPNEVAAVAQARADGADRGPELLLAPPAGGNDVITALAPLPEPPPPQRRKTWIEREQEAAANQFAFDAIQDRFAREAEAREALEERRRVRRDREHEALQQRIEAAFHRPAAALAPRPAPEPAADEGCEEELLTLASELNELMGIDDE
jgi:hypothetical protein